MNRIKGNITNYTNFIIGRFDKDNNICTKDRIVYCTKKPLITVGIQGYIVPKGCAFKTNKPLLEIEGDVPFKNGDIISISAEGIVSLIWDNQSPHNALYVTDICNSKCIMCPQIECAQPRYNECLKILDHVKLDSNASIGITGGEPTLNIDKLVEILSKIAKKSPKQQVHILTNGRLFKNLDIVEKLASVKNLRVSVGIPLYSDIAEEHDFIVGVKGAFNETLQGLYNLGRMGINIEIRTVILKQNYTKLKDLAEYIYRNLPFVSKVALMGLEYHGNAETNYNLIAIDPLDYKHELFEAVRQYVRYNLLVDVYNTPLCLVDSRIEEFCRDSISTWKKSYTEACKSCIKKEICSGVFETSFKHSENIHPIKTIQNQ